MRLVLNQILRKSSLSLVVNTWVLLFIVLCTIFIRFSSSDSSYKKDRPELINNSAANNIINHTFYFFNLIEKLADSFSRTLHQGLSTSFKVSAASEVGS